MQPVSFAPSEGTSGGTNVTLLSPSGENLQAHVQDDVTILGLKQALAVQLRLTSAHEVILCVVGDETPTHDSVLVSSCKADDVPEAPVSSETAVSRSVTMTIIKVPMTLERFEEKSVEEWRGLAKQLQSKTITDDAMLVYLCTFLDKYPALINWQTTLEAEAAGPFKPLLSFAVEACPSTEWRQQCVDELLKRGARIHIRHEQGFLIDMAGASGSAFVPYLKQKAQQFKVYEARALASWRAVSSQLCGETNNPVADEAAMTRNVAVFCVTHPEMVNFQNNHAVNESTDEPYGYFRYSPLISFAGAQACRRRRGGNGEDENVRRGSVEVLLKHGTRVDSTHGGHTAMEWMKQEGSQMIAWLQDQLAAPIPWQEPYHFRGSGAAPAPHQDPANRTNDEGNQRRCCIQ